MTTEEFDKFEEHLRSAKRMPARDEFRMHLFVAVYIKSVNLNKINPADAARLAVADFDKSFPHA